MTHSSSALRESAPVRVVQYGMGPIGRACARVLMDKARAGHVELVGCIDISPDLVGVRVDTLVGGICEVRIANDGAAALEAARPDVVLHTTGSYLLDVKDQILECVRAGAHVVSSTEELTYPFSKYPKLSDELDAVARECGVVILGTGVNPGYAMDTLALAATGVSTSAQRIEVDRVVDASQRREPLQRKIGAGLTVKEFRRRRDRGGFGHVGLRESLEVVATGLGWALDEMEETLEPVLADRKIETDHVSVPRGHVAGVYQTAVGNQAGRELIRLTLKMYLGAEDPIDRVRVHGTPPIDMIVKGGIFGDTATVGSLVNAIPRVMDATPGLHTVISVPVPRAFGV